MLSRLIILIAFILIGFFEANGQQLLLGKTQSQIIEIAHDKKWKLVSTSKPQIDSIFKEVYAIKEDVLMDIEYNKQLKCVKATYIGGSGDYLQIVTDLDDNKGFRKIAPNEWLNENNRIKAKVWADTVKGNTVTYFECVYY